jgi:diguanylate cyclase
MWLKGLDWSSTGRTRVYFWTLAGTLACIAIALAVDYPNYSVLEPAGRNRALLVNVFLPMALAGPALYVLTSKIRQLALAQDRLTILASTDSLTAVLNRGAFTMLVDAYLKQASAQNDAMRGALLVIDADHFKDINDNYGHDRGDEALRLIAQGIKGVLRGADIVGRIGGEEFGVFLPGSNVEHAVGVAERIRTAIVAVDFRPDGERRPLSVSVGGATFARRIGFSELYRIADQRLYAAKHSGRNRISVVPTPALEAA